MVNNKWLLPIDAHRLLVEAPIVATHLSLLFGIDAIEAIRNQRAERTQVVRQELLGLGALIRCAEHLPQRNIWAEAGAHSGRKEKQMVVGLWRLH